MAQRIVVDPVTRIEGHLRVEAEVKDGKISNAYSSGTMVRGIEIILKGRDPRDAWAFTQRFCGVCTTVHAFASIRAVEDALKITIPPNANLIRNIMIAAQYVHDHVMHFYHLHALDWVDVVSALKADPARTSQIAQSLSRWPNSSTGYFKEVQKKLKAFIESGQLGIFANGYWGHPGYKLPPEVNLLGVAHYLEALDWQKDVVKIHTIFGGKNPHPNFVVGGMACALDPNSDAAINAARLAVVSDVINSMETFVDQVYIPDLLAVAGYYKEWAQWGEGLGNFLSWGDLPAGDINDPSKFVIPRGVILNRNIAEVLPVDPKDMDQVKEFVTHSWYTYAKGDGTGLHPWEGETALKYTGPKPPYEFLEVDKKYSWLKSPRWKEKSMEVGPLARVLMLYATGNAQAKELVEMTLKRLNVPVTALFSTLGRTAARGLETKIFADTLRSNFDALVGNIRGGDLRTFDAARWEPSTWPKEAKGFGFMEAPRGALGHWVVIQDEKIANYQAVVPSTWNASPMDHQQQHGAYEAALIGTPVHDEKQPLEILRTLHSFDPCIACAVHLIDLNGEEVSSVRVL